MHSSIDTVQRRAIRLQVLIYINFPTKAQTSITSQVHTSANDNEKVNVNEASITPIAYFFSFRSDT